VLEIQKNTYLHESTTVNQKDVGVLEVFAPLEGERKLVSH